MFHSGSVGHPLVTAVFDNGMDLRPTEKGWRYSSVDRALACSKPWAQSLVPHTLGMMTLAFNPGTWVVDAGGYKNLRVILSYVVNLRLAWPT